MFLLQKILKPSKVKLGLIILLVASNGFGKMSNESASRRDRKQGVDKLYSAARTLAGEGTKESLEESILRFKAARESYRAAGDRQNEAFCLQRLGEVNNWLGQNQEALIFLNEALSVWNSINSIRGKVKTLATIGVVYTDLGEYQEALNLYHEALNLWQIKGELSNKAEILNNIGAIYSKLGENQIALKYFNEALPLRQTVKDKVGEAITLNNIGLVYSNSFREAKDRQLYYASGNWQICGDFTVYRLSGNPQSSGETLKLTNFLYFLHRQDEICLEEKQKAFENYNQALMIFKAIKHKRGQAVTLSRMGKVYDDSGEKQKAIVYFEQSLLLRKEVGDKGGEAMMLGWLQNYWKRVGNARFAIFYGKQSVNKYQELRQSIEGLDRELQKSYLGTIEQIYRNLVDILIAEGRISEAEQVLAMLKEEEVFSYLRRDDKVAKELLETVSLNPEEREALIRYNKLADKITAVGKEFGELDWERRKQDEGQFRKQTRYDELENQLADATLTFQKFLEELKIKFGEDNLPVASVDSDLKATLQRIAEQQSEKKLKVSRVAVISTIVGKDRLNIIVTTANTQRAHTIDITDGKINQLVADFRQALINPQIDPRPTGQKLYDVLVKPVEADLAGIDAETILWSLDGTLRYIPTAALWDKRKGYLAESYNNVVLTLASRDTLALDVKERQSWKALGVGVSKATEGFPALDDVPDELDCIINDTQSKNVSPNPICQNGVITGRKLLDEEFTLTNFKNSLGRFPIVHIASHFSLNPGSTNDSFLLLGGGENRRFTFEKLRNVSLTEVELIVLSACNTATPGGEKTNGVEIESFGTVAQKRGAKAVLATLWSVADNSTRVLMVKFYELYDKGSSNKAEAVRQAQLAMLYGGYKPEEAGTKNIVVPAESSRENKTRFLFKADQQAPFAHPYYWSPFVLYGNWR